MKKSVCGKGSLRVKSPSAKADHVLRGMGLGHPEKTEAALAELAEKGMTPD